MPGKVFVNYRRDDERSTAARIRDRLAATFGDADVFMDVDDLLAGQRFDKELEKALDQADVFVCVIGPRWMELLAERQASGERDYVREEITGALQRGLVVIPVLIERTPLPRADALPEDIRDLVLYQKHVVAHERFGRDVADLAQAIGRVREKAHGERSGINDSLKQERSGSNRPRRKWALTGIGIALTVAAIYFFAASQVPPKGEGRYRVYFDEKALQEERKQAAEEAERQRLAAEQHRRAAEAAAAKKAEEEAQAGRVAEEAEIRLAILKFQQDLRSPVQPPSPGPKQDAPASAATVPPPTPEEYVARVGGDATIVPSGELTLDGRKVICGSRPTVLDSRLDEYSAAYPGFLILNPRPTRQSVNTRKVMGVRTCVRISVPWAGRATCRLLCRAAWSPPGLVGARGAR